MKVPTNLRKRLRHSLLILLGGVLLALPLWAQAQQAPILSAADKQAKRGTRLRERGFGDSHWKPLPGQPTIKDWTPYPWPATNSTTP